MCDQLKPNKQNHLAAGKFSVWLNEFIKAMEGKKSSHVPCGPCDACCTSSNFVHIRPTDKDTLHRIPKEIIFSAPGLPKGHFLLGYDEKGHCPMFKEGKCSIYEYRPETCRQYDCRVYPATGVSLDEKNPKIAQHVERWRFDISSSDDLEKFRAVQQAAAFLIKNRDRFPSDCVMRTNSQLAVFAIRIHKIFIGQELSSLENDVKNMVDSIVLRYRNYNKNNYSSSSVKQN